MKLINQIKNEDGFAIQEILVVLIVGSILVSLSLALFQFTNELFQTWYGTSEMKSDVNRIMYTLALDVQRSSNVIEKTDTTLVLSRGVGRILRYTFGNQILKRDDIDLVPQKIKLFQVKIDELPLKAGSMKVKRWDFCDANHGK